MENELIMVHVLEMEIIEEERGNIRRQLIVQRQNPFNLSELNFKKIFRFSKEGARFVINTLEPYMQPPSRTSAIDRQTKVLVTLHFFATGSYQSDIGQNIFSALSQGSVSNCIAEVTDALNEAEIFNEWVKFPPTVADLQSVCTSFFAKYEFPGVIGVIDCTHVAIVPPNATDENYSEHIYVNRKGFHSLNVQLVCDSSLKIISLNPRFPGSCNDMYVWNHSAIKGTLRNLSRQHPGFYLIGDSGYALRPWLQIPLPNAEAGSPEERYNEAFRRTRSTVERCIGVWKMRFRCLLKHRVLHYTPTKAAKIIKACAVLHNMCIFLKEAEPPLEDIEYENLGILDPFEENQNGNGNNLNRRNPDLVAGERLQNQVIRNHFRI